MSFLALLLSVFLAWTLASAKKCQNFTIPVELSARNGVFGIPAPQNDIEVTDFSLQFSRQGSNYTQSILKDYKMIIGTYNLSVTHCAPDNGESKVLQILTHGAGFDKSYWDLPFNNYNYSYVSVAVDQFGYSTLAWDRVGVGASQHGDALAEIQAPLTQAALAALTKRARTRGDDRGGNNKGRNSKIFHDGPPFGGNDKVVHVGHSYGSMISYALARDDPSMSDGLVLQGLAFNQTFFPYFLLGLNMIPVTDLTPAYTAGYLAAGNPAALHTSFLAPGQYDPEMISYAYKNGQPVAMGELLTLSSAMSGISDFAGPVMVITGEKDLPFCGGDCYATGDPKMHSIMDNSKDSLPKAKNLNVTVVPGEGHALNMGYGHAVMYQQMNGFLVANGLGAKVLTG